MTSDGHPVLGSASSASHLSDEERKQFSPIIEHPEAAIIMLDFDGTIAPIVQIPEQARPLPAAVKAIAAMAEVIGEMAIVSGRPIGFLRSVLPGLPPTVKLSGLYGMQRVENGHVVLDAVAQRYRGAVEAAASEAEALLPGLLIERKDGAAVTVHWRMSPDRGELAESVARSLGEKFGLLAQPGRMAMELRPPVGDKGVAITDLVRGFRSAMFVGDDVGDLDGFSALRKLALAGSLETAILIAVDSSEQPTELAAQADLVVADPQALAELLTALASTLARRRHS